MATWYSVQTKQLEPKEDGSLKLVTKEQLVDAVSFTDAEVRTMQLLKKQVNDFTIEKVTKTDYKEVIHNENTEGWVKVKTTQIGINDKGLEFKVNFSYLFAADNVVQGIEYAKEYFKNSIVDSEIVAVSKTKIVEVYPYVADENKLLCETVKEKS